MPLLSPPLPGLRRPPPARLPPPLRPAVTPRVAPVHAPAHPGSHWRPLAPPRHPFRAPHGHHRSVPLRAPPSRPETRPPDAVGVQPAWHVALLLPPRRPASAGQHRPGGTPPRAPLHPQHDAHVAGVTPLPCPLPHHRPAPPPLLPHVPTPPSTQPHTLRHSIALVWLLRHCATWRLTVDRHPVVPLPPGPLPGPHLAHVVFTPSSRAADILSLLVATPPGHRILLAPTPRSSVRSSSGTPTPCTCARCCPTCTPRTPPAHPSTHPCGTPSEATGLRPVRTHHPALASGTRPRGRRYPHARPRPRPPSSAPCQPRVPRPSGGPRQARRHPRPCAPRSLACTAHSPPALPRAPRCGALGASADRRLGRTRLPATAKAPGPTRPPAATHPPGPGLSPRATQPAHRRSLGPQRGPQRARRRPCARALRSKTCRTRPPPARPPTPLCGTLRATADRRLDRPRPPATATGPAPAWRHVLPGRPPLPTRTARAATPRRLCRAASRTQGTGTGTREHHMNRTQHASDSEPMFVLLCSRPCALPPP